MRAFSAADLKKRGPSTGLSARLHLNNDKLKLLIMFVFRF